MSSSSKTSPSSRIGSSPEMSPEVAAEIARLMRDPNSMRAEAEHMRRSGGGGHYDPNQPRVPAGDSRGGQFASKGYRGGDAGVDVRATRTSFDGAQFAELGQGNPGDAAPQPFNGMFGDISATQHRTSRLAFIRGERDRRTNPRTRVSSFEAGAGGPDNRGRFVFVATEGLGAVQPRPDGGMQMVVSSTTYAYDRLTGAYATIRATPQRPIEIQEINGEVFIGSYR
jgi:hypothetical protein